MVKKKISVVVPCYNDADSLEELNSRVKNIFEKELDNYDYEVIFVDDGSKDCTSDVIKRMCLEDQLHCKGVINSKNFGFQRNVFASFFYASGDAVFLMFGDIQDPPEMIPGFVEEWERGSKCVLGQRIKTEEKGVKKFFREAYYYVIDILSQTKQIHNMNGYGLYDKTIISTMKEIEEVSPFLKTVIAEYATDIAVVQYEQSNGRRGKSNFNFWKNYDFMMQGITSSTKMLMRIATFLGAFVGIISLLYACYVVIRKLIAWESYPFGIAQLMVALLVLGSLQLFFIGILGEYILSINSRVVKKPRTIVKTKIGFEEVNDNDNSNKKI